MSLRTSLSITEQQTDCMFNMTLVKLPVGMPSFLRPTFISPLVGSDCLKPKKTNSNKQRVQRDPFLSAQRCFPILSRELVTRGEASCVREMIFVIIGLYAASIGGTQVYTPLLCCA